VISRRAVKKPVAGGRLNIFNATWGLGRSFDNTIGVVRQHWPTARRPGLAGAKDDMHESCATTWALAATLGRSARQLPRKLAREWKRLELICADGDAGNSGPPPVARARKPQGSLPVPVTTVAVLERRGGLSSGKTGTAAQRFSRKESFPCAIFMTVISRRIFLNTARENLAESGRPSRGLDEDTTPAGTAWILFGAADRCRDVAPAAGRHRDARISATWRAIG